MRTAIQAIDNQLLRDLPTNSEDLEPQQTLKITGVDSIQKITKYLECVHCSKSIIQGTCTDMIICEHCGYTMKTDSCQTKVVAKIVIKMDDQEESCFMALWIIFLCIILKTLMCWISQFNLA